MIKYYTVEQIAELLTIHPKTIQRYIREGKLRAAKVGKSWRVTERDLRAFTENTELTESKNVEKEQNKVNISCVADIMIDEADEAIQIINLLTAALNGKPESYENATMYTQYLEQENKVRVTLWGHLLFMQEILELISVVTGSSTDNT